MWCIKPVSKGKIRKLKKQNIFQEKFINRKKKGFETKNLEKKYEKQGA